MNARTTRIVGLAGLALAATTASAATYNLDWLSMAPVLFGNTPPNNSSYFMPGVGNVTISYTNPIPFLTARFDANPSSGNGSVISGDTYQWTNAEMFARTNIQPAPPLNESWDITWTFPSTLAANSIVLGVQGLGRRDDPNGGTPGAVTTVTCLQNGTYLGEFTNLTGQGTNLFTPGAGIFTLENGVTGVGGADPHWNTPLGLVLINDSIASLTLRIVHTSGDGIGVNIAFVPAPGAAALMGLSALATVGRRRRG